MRKVIWRPFTQMKNGTPPLKVKSAYGAKLELEDGQTIIDAISSWWVITHGHCEPAIVKAIQEQAQHLDQVLFANFTHSSAEEFTQLLQQVLPDPLKYVFFSDNGSTAVEVALKMALQAHQQNDQPQRNLFLAFENAYHGDTVGAMSVGGRSLFTKPYEDLLFRVLHAKQGTHSYDSHELWLNDFLEKFEKHQHELAGIILEPLIQGAGGMVVWPKEVVQKICQLAQENQIYLIFDEIMTGFGRTGSLFALEQLNISPDFLCLSKGITGGFLPLSVTITTEEIFSKFLGETKSNMFFHGHSFTGNPLSCAAACANLRLIQERDLLTEWERINKIHQIRLQQLPKKYSLIDKRICGTIAAIEMETKEQGYQSGMAEKITKFALKRGVFLRPLGNILYLLPPYSIQNEELHLLWDVIEEILEEYS